MRAPNAQSDRVIHNGCAAGKLKEQCKQYGDQFTRTTPRQTSPELTLLVNAPRPISNAIGVNFTREMYAISLAFKRRMQDRFFPYF